MMPTFKEEDSGRDHFESEMVYLGFVTILDPPREGVKKSVEQCRDAGVSVIMVTGDSPTTAKSIATQISIITSENDKVVMGKDIKDISSLEEFNSVKVFARVSPTDKEIIVEEYQNQEKVVAMFDHMPEGIVRLIEYALIRKLEEQHTVAPPTNRVNGYSAGGVVSGSSVQSSTFTNWTEVPSN